MEAQMDKLKEFFQKPQAKYILIGLGSLIFLVVIVVLITSFLGGGQVEVPAPTSAPGITLGLETTETTPTFEPLDKGLEVFSAEGFKDPFQPLTLETTAAEATVTAGPYLKSISYGSDGQPVAEFLYNGETYSLTVGEQLADSPYMVLEIGGNWVKLLYGDDIITLSIGEAHSDLSSK
jgi:hypothetical protein